MNIRARIHKRYRQLGKSLLRAPDEEAEAMALAVSEAHSVLGGFCNFCLLPSGRAMDVNYSILKRWLDVVPQLLVVPNIVSRKRIESETVKLINDATLAEIYEVANKIGLECCDLNSAEASELANCIRNAASPAFAFYQRCMAPEDFSLKEHGSMLRAFLDGCLPYAAAANALFFERRKSG